MEGDGYRLCGFTCACVSIHTLAWRVTVDFLAFNFFKSVSIHTLAWRVTGWSWYGLVAYEVSIHTLAWRVT